MSAEVEGGDSDSTAIVTPVKNLFRKFAECQSDNGSSDSLESEQKVHKQSPIWKFFGNTPERRMEELRLLDTMLLEPKRGRPHQQQQEQEQEQEQ
jgi:hypothetical protein